MHAAPSDNLGMEKNASTSVRGEPFTTGALVIATLSNPREKFWGMILALAPEGLSLSGAELASFEDLTLMVSLSLPRSSSSPCTVSSASNLICLTEPCPRSRSVSCPRLA